MPGYQLLFSPTKLVCKPGAISTLAQEAAALGVRRLMLVCGTRSARSLAAQRAREALGPLLVDEWAGIPAHSSTNDVARMASRARERGIDGFVTVGGGSASDSAKAAAILLAEGGDLVDHANVFTPPDHYEQKILRAPKLPILAVPTTLSAAEMTPGLGVRDEAGHKHVFWDQGVVPRVIILDPCAIADVPTPVLTTTGMNALAHCIEGMYSKVRNPVSEALALQGMRHLRKALPALARAAQGDASGRQAALEHALTGAALSGLVISNARVGIHHGICHGLGALGGLSHGVANSVLLPHAMRFNLEAATDQLALAAPPLGIDTSGMSPADAARASIGAVLTLQSEAGVPTRLRDTGLDRGLLRRLAGAAMSDRGLYFNPRLATESEVLALLESAW
jgi:alcohol dehydrogenase class IV